MSRKQSITRNQFPIALLLIRYNQNWFVKINPKWCFTVWHCGDFAFSVWTMFWNYFLPRIPVATNISGKKWTRNNSKTSFRIIPEFSEVVLRRLFRRWAVAVTHLHASVRSQRLVTLPAPYFMFRAPVCIFFSIVQLAFLPFRPVHFLYAHEIELVMCVMSTDHWWWNLFEKISQVGSSCGVADRVWKFLVGIKFGNEWFGIEKKREMACWHRMQWVQQDFCLAVSLWPAHEAMLCAELRVVHYLTKTGRTCMQSADRTCPLHHCCVDLHIKQEVVLSIELAKSHKNIPSQKLLFCIFCIFRIFVIFFCPHTRPTSCG